MSGFSRTLVAVVAIVLVQVPVWAQSAQKSGAREKDPFGPKAVRSTSGAAIDRQAFARDIGRAASLLAGRTKTASRMAPGDGNVLRSAELLRLREISGGPVQAEFDEELGIPVFLRGHSLTRIAAGEPRKLTDTDREQRAQQFLAENTRLLRLSRPQEEFRRTDLSVDELGMTHIRYQQTYRGMDVWGHDVRVHLSRDGNVESFNGRYVPTPAETDRQQVLISRDQAIGTARSAFRGVPGTTEAGLVIDVRKETGARICWLVNTRGALDENMMTFVDAETGRILRSYNHVFYDGPVTGSGTDLLGQNRSLKLYQLGSTFYMVDASKPMFNAAQSSLPQDGKGVIYTLDAQNADSSLFFVTSGSATSWPLASAVSASANGGKVYDYYNTVLGRNAIDGNGSTMSLVVRFKVGFNNAFWNGQLMVFGTGDGSAFSDLAGAMDVTAHEMTHGVVERTANLVYENQPGALNESFADAMGAMAEVWADPSRSDWWMIGEAVTTPSIPGDVLRRLDQPDASNIAFNGQQPAHMNQYQNLPNTEQGDNGGVHVNSGIPNHAFYLFATSAGVTLDDAAKVYYRALTQYLTRNSQFIDCRLAVIKAAEDLFGGPGNAKALAAAAAFDAVGIMSGSATPPPPTQPPVVGTNFLAVIEASSGLLYRTTTAGGSITQLTATGLWSRPAATDDGSLIFYVDGNTNLHAVGSDGSNDQALTSSGGFNNISVSPNGRYLAATSTLGQPTIYVFDLVNGGNATAVPLYTPTYTEGVNAGTILYPDRIDWASDSQILMYDALNQVVNATGDSVQYWDINLLRVSDGAIGRLFPPQPTGVNIGNAVFASNSDNTIAFDYFREGDSVRVYAVDLNTGTLGQVTNNWFSLGSPSFSADDRKVYYHYIDQSGAAVYVVSLASDGVTGTGDDQILLNGATYPVSFTVGTRPTSGAEENSTAPLAFGLSQNYPNPFNPSTAIEYDLDAGGFASIIVYDLLGRHVATLLKGRQEAGHHTVTFEAGALPTGVYLVQLEAGGKRSARRISLIR